MQKSQKAHLVLENFYENDTNSVAKRENLQFWLTLERVALSCSFSLGWKEPSENIKVINGYQVNSLPDP